MGVRFLGGCAQDAGDGGVGAVGKGLVESGEFVDALLDSVQQFDRQVVPLVMDSAHRKISKTHGLCYQSLIALNEAKAQKGEQQRARHLKESEKWCKEALQTREAGFKEFWRNSKGEPRH